MIPSQPGLNEGANQVENIILMFTPPSAYYPSEDTLLELGLTHGCTEAIECRNVLQTYQGEHE